MKRKRGAFAGTDRFDARKRIVEKLQSRVAGTNCCHSLSVGVCDPLQNRGQPRVSEQWFCKMKEMATRRLPPLTRTDPVVPRKQRAVYLNWMANIRDGASRANSGGATGFDLVLALTAKQ